MDVPSLFYRMAELTEESLLAELIQGNRVMIYGTWYTIGKRVGKVVFLDGAGSDYSFSDLSIIEKVEWVSPEPRTTELAKTESNQSVADVLKKLGR